MWFEARSGNGGQYRGNGAQLQIPAGGGVSEKIVTSRFVALWLSGVAIPAAACALLLLWRHTLMPNYGRFRHASRCEAFTVVINHFTPAVSALVAGFEVDEPTRP